MTTKRDGVYFIGQTFMTAKSDHDSSLAMLFMTINSDKDNTVLKLSWRPKVTKTFQSMHQTEVVQSMCQTDLTC